MSLPSPSNTRTIVNPSGSVLAGGMSPSRSTLPISMYSRSAWLSCLIGTVITPPVASSSCTSSSDISIILASIFVPTSEVHLRTGSFDVRPPSTARNVLTAYFPITYRRSAGANCSSGTATYRLSARLSVTCPAIKSTNSACTVRPLTAVQVLIGSPAAGGLPVTVASVAPTDVIQGKLATSTNAVTRCLTDLMPSSTITVLLSGSPDRLK